MALSDAVELQPADLPVEAAGPAGSTAFTRALIASAAEKRLSLQEVEDLYTEEILQATGGNKVQAAKILGIDRKTLYRRRSRCQQGEQ